MGNTEKPDRTESTTSQTIAGIILTLLVGLIVATMGIAEDKSDAAVIWAIVLGILAVIIFVLYWFVRLIRALSGGNAAAPPVAVRPSGSIPAAPAVPPRRQPCPRCGAQPPPHANFCPDCGAPLPV